MSQRAVWCPCLSICPSQQWRSWLKNTEVSPKVSFCGREHANIQVGIISCGETGLTSLCNGVGWNGDVILLNLENSVVRIKPLCWGHLSQPPIYMQVNMCSWGATIAVKFHCKTYIKEICKTQTVASFVVLWNAVNNQLRSECRSDDIVRSNSWCSSI